MDRVNGFGIGYNSKTLLIFLLFLKDSKFEISIMLYHT